MNISLILTDAEQRILDSAFRILGENLAEFLLSGLGEAHRTKRRTFTAQSTNPQGVSICYKLEMLNESKQGLPINHDPLVFAALLQILSERKFPRSKVRFRDQVVLTRLQWPQSIESELLIKQAIERYVYTAHYLLDTKLPEEERIDGQYSCCRRLLTGFETISTRQSLPSEKAHSHKTVLFNPEFLPIIGADLKQFMGLDFKSLRSLRQVSFENSGLD